ncbi:UDP-Glycosyltransferase/glycogen phosphorylase [Gigaspora margarita]|uniref:UDP-Glycosyltransferase/glycogen phosphorylase n=2 Tax=Gigaspora margarita TaxID=4874 RepID=A0A8H4AKN0_GIGMA|nr:UDP-Glycosyltransferase/glycogen phosphorylase [Gigaspora margarita]
MFHSKLWYIIILIIFFINTDRFKITVEGKSNGFFQREPDLDKNDNNKPKNILVASKIGGISHLRPMLEICKILEDRGYKITLASPGNFTATSTLYHSIPQIITGERPKTHESIFRNKFTMETLFNINMNLINEYAEDFNNYLQAYKETKADLFFCDYMANDACFDLAWKLNKPVVGFSRVLTPHPPYVARPILGCRVNMENESFYNRFICAVIKPLQLQWYSRKYLNYLNDKRAEVGVSIHDFRERLMNTLFLVDNFFGFEVSFARLPIYKEVGPILPDTSPNLTSDLNLFLSTHPRTMYIALGTTVYTTPENFAILLHSILELINQNILDGVIWATGLFNESELASTFTLTTNDVIFTSNILNNSYPHIRIIKYSPQFAILSHENTKVFLGHGGVGSYHEAMLTATPMLVLPIAFDQIVNADALELTGKHKGADLIEIVMNLAKLNKAMNEDNELEADNRVLLKHWTNPDSRLGLIRGNNLDVFVIVIALISGLGYGFYKIMFTFKRQSLNDGNPRESSSKPKNE